MEIRPSENKGFAVDHNMRGGSDPWNSSTKTHVFGNGHEMLRHIAKVHKIGREAKRGKASRGGSR